MPTPTAHDDVRIVDTVDDGGNLIRRAQRHGAVVGLALAAVLVAVGGTLAVWLAPAVVLAATAAAHDLRVGRLPDRLVVAAVVSGLVGAVAIDGIGAIGPFLTGVLALSLPLLAFHLASPCAMAFGDVKFAAGLGGPLGLAGTDLGDRVFLAMVALTIASGSAVVLAVAVRSRQLPFGPSLYAGTFATLVVAIVTRSPFG